METLESVVEKEDMEIGVSSSPEVGSSSEGHKLVTVPDEDEPRTPKIDWEDVVPDEDGFAYSQNVTILYGLESEPKKTLVETVGSDEVRVKYNIEFVESPVQELDLGQEGIRDPVKYAHIRSHRERLNEMLKWQDARAWWYFDHRIRPYGKR